MSQGDSAGFGNYRAVRRREIYLAWASAHLKEVTVSLTAVTVYALLTLDTEKEKNSVYNDLQHAISSPP